MNDFSLIEKLKILMNIILSSPLFFICSLALVTLIIFYIVCIKMNKKINRWIFFSIWALLLLILIINYNAIIFELIDNVFDSLFMAIYFPDFSIYILMLVISNFVFIYSIFSRKISTLYKVVNVLSSSIINVLLLLIIDITKRNGINIYDKLSIYSNPNLQVLIELSMGIFISWILINLLITAHYKLKKFDKKEYPEMPEIIFDDI